MTWRARRADLRAEFGPEVIARAVFSPLQLGGAGVPTGSAARLILFGGPPPPTLRVVHGPVLPASYDTPPWCSPDDPTSTMISGSECITTFWARQKVSKQLMTWLNLTYAEVVKSLQPCYYSVSRSLRTIMSVTN